jgi:hypothetical protein
MLRGPIIRTLLYKEVLRYRYNWGLLVMIAALLALAALVSISARLQVLPGQSGLEVRRCYVYCARGSPEAAAWQEHLRKHPPPSPYRVEFNVRLLYHAGGDRPALPPASMAIELMPPQAQTEEGVWKVRYWYLKEAPAGILPYRDWFARETHRFLQSKPLFEEETETTITDIERTDRVPMIITALVVFSLYLPSFNLYITSTGEEREKRMLLALLLTPATAAEMVAAKAIFYALVSMGVAAAIVAMYDPLLLLNPLLWSTVFFGSVGYVALGTLVISVVRRQTTINTVSMLYLVATGIIMFLSTILPLFGLVRHLLVEDYLYRQMHQIISGQTAWWVGLNQAALAGMSLLWSAVAVVVFARQGMSISRSR